MADPFFDGGHLPPQFNRASGAAPEPERKRPDDPELNYDPPEPSPPGLGPGGATVTREVAQEELDGPSRDAVQQAQDRMDRGETEMGDPMLTQEFDRAGWSSQEIEDVQQEDQARSLDFENEWDEQSQREYDRWQMESARDHYDDQWSEQEATEDYERYAASMNRSADNEAMDEQEKAYSDFMRDQNAEIELSHDFSQAHSPEHDRDIEH